MTDLWAAVGAIPPAALGALGAAVSGLIGGLLGAGLTQWLTHRRHKEQLQHDARHRTADRDAKLRTDVYLELVSLFPATGRELMQLTKGLTPDFKVNDACAGALNKAMVVSNQATASALSGLAMELDKARIELIYDSQTLVNLTRDLNAKEAEQQAGIDRLKRLVQQLEQEFDGTERHRTTIQALDRVVDRNRSTRAEYLGVREKREKEALAFFLRAHDRIHRLSITAFSAMQLLRKDLGVEGAFDTHPSDREKNHNANRQRVEQMLAKQPNG